MSTSAASPTLSRIPSRLRAPGSSGSPAQAGNSASGKSSTNAAATSPGVRGKAQRPRDTPAKRTPASAQRANAPADAKVQGGELSLESAWKQRESTMGKSKHSAGATSIPKPADFHTPRAKGALASAGVDVTPAVTEAPDLADPPAADGKVLTATTMSHLQLLLDGAVAVGAGLKAPAQASPGGTHAFLSALAAAHQADKGNPTAGPPAVLANDEGLSGPSAVTGSPAGSDLQGTTVTDSEQPGMGLATLAAVGHSVSADMHDGFSSSLSSIPSDVPCSSPPCAAKADDAAYKEGFSDKSWDDPIPAVPMTDGCRLRRGLGSHDFLPQLDKGHGLHGNDVQVSDINPLVFDDTTTELHRESPVFIRPVPPLRLESITRNRCSPPGERDPLSAEAPSTPSTDLSSSVPLDNPPTPGSPDTLGSREAMEVRDNVAAVLFSPDPVPREESSATLGTSAGAESPTGTREEQAGAPQIGQAIHAGVGPASVMHRASAFNASNQVTPRSDSEHTTPRGLMVLRPGAATGDTGAEGCMSPQTPEWMPNSSMELAMNNVFEGVVPSTIERAFADSTQLSGRGSSIGRMISPALSPASSRGFRSPSNGFVPVDSLQKQPAAMSDAYRYSKSNFSSLRSSLRSSLPRSADDPDSDVFQQAVQHPTAIAGRDVSPPHSLASAAVGAQVSPAMSGNLSSPYASNNVPLGRKLSSTEDVPHDAGAVVPGRTVSGRTFSGVMSQQVPESVLRSRGDDSGWVYPIDIHATPSSTLTMSHELPISAADAGAARTESAKSPLGRSEEHALGSAAREGAAQVPGGKAAGQVGLQEASEGGQGDVRLASLLSTLEKVEEDSHSVGSGSQRRQKFKVPEELLSSTLMSSTVPGSHEHESTCSTHSSEGVEPVSPQPMGEAVMPAEHAEETGVLGEGATVQVSKFCALDSLAFPDTVQVSKVEPADEYTDVLEGDTTALLRRPAHSGAEALRVEHRVTPGLGGAAHGVSSGRASFEPEGQGQSVQLSPARAVVDDGETLVLGDELPSGSAGRGLPAGVRGATTARARPSQTELDDTDSLELSDVEQPAVREAAMPAQPSSAYVPGDDGNAARNPSVYVPSAGAYSPADSTMKISPARSVMDDGDTLVLGGEVHLTSPSGKGGGSVDGSFYMPEPVASPRAQNAATPFGASNAAAQDGKHSGSVFEPASEPHSASSSSSFGGKSHSQNASPHAPVSHARPADDHPVTGGSPDASPRSWQHAYVPRAVESPSPRSQLRGCKTPDSENLPSSPSAKARVAADVRNADSSSEFLAADPHEPAVAAPHGAGDGPADDGVAGTDQACGQASDRHESMPLSELSDLSSADTDVGFPRQCSDELASHAEQPKSAFPPSEMNMMDNALLAATLSSVGSAARASAGGKEPTVETKEAPAQPPRALSPNVSTGGPSQEKSEEPEDTVPNKQEDAVPNTMIQRAVARVNEAGHASNPRPDENSTSVANSATSMPSKKLAGLSQPTSKDSSPKQSSRFLPAVPTERKPDDFPHVPDLPPVSSPGVAARTGRAAPTGAHTAPMMSPFETTMQSTEEVDDKGDNLAAALLAPSRAHSPIVTNGMVRSGPASAKSSTCNLRGVASYSSFSQPMSPLRSHPSAPLKSEDIVRTVSSEKPVIQVPKEEPKDWGVSKGPLRDADRTVSMPPGLQLAHGNAGMESAPGLLRGATKPVREANPSDCVQESYKSITLGLPNSTNGWSAKYEPAPPSSQSGAQQPEIQVTLGPISSAYRASKYGGVTAQLGVEPSAAVQESLAMARAVDHRDDYDDRDAALQSEMNKNWMCCVFGGLKPKKSGRSGQLPLPPPDYARRMRL